MYCILHLLIVKSRDQKVDMTQQLLGKAASKLLSSSELLCIKIDNKALYYRNIGDDRRGWVCVSAF